MLPALAVIGGAQVLGLALGVSARRRQRRAERRALAIRQKNAEEFAVTTLKKGLTEADLIYSKAVSTRGTQMAQQAASGVVVGNGSARAITERTLSLGQADALIAIAESKSKAKQIRQGSVYDAMETKSRISAINAAGDQQAIQAVSSIATASLLGRK